MLLKVMVIGSKKLVNDGPTEKTIINMAHLRNLLAEQDGYAELEEKDCDVYLIVAYLDGELYGMVYCFYNAMYPDIILFQGISKTPKYGLWDILDRTKYGYLPRLNSVLMPAIESLAKRLGVNKILVSPIGNQSSILEKHYGFRRTNRQSFQYPCHNIAGSKFSAGSYLIKDVP